MAAFCALISFEYFENFTQVINQLGIISFKFRTKYYKAIQATSVRTDVYWFSSACLYTHFVLFVCSLMKILKYLFRKLAFVYCPFKSAKFRLLFSVNN